jgi:hypothetical protein
MTKQNGFNGIVRKLHLSFVSTFSPVGPCIRRSLLQKPPPSTSLQNSNVKWYTESKTKEKPTPTQTSIEPLLYKPPLLNIYSGVAREVSFVMSYRTPMHANRMLRMRFRQSCSREEEEEELSYGPEDRGECSCGAGVRGGGA